MQSVCLREAGVNAKDPWAEETTLVGLIFGGYIRSKIKCMKCKGKSERHERMMDLTVEIQGDIGTLEEALGRFTTTEILDGDSKYKCSSMRKNTIVKRIASHNIAVEKRYAICGFCYKKQHQMRQDPSIYGMNLSSFLFGGSGPDWYQRIQIAFGIAQGIIYLHEECSSQIIHCDIKPQNILLDDSFNVKISDFI
ncbi:hypothetical protein GIB67_035294 [Kingdonia uniflora]|uniref:Protein kinase domain-containing protein n=1 Tax=Kingdonia uniflora TaxID=39325 RepID=A0A7J7KXZ4_9MAGN|nr:hypothetical protein GIB67_035294 [Kingdonia uniflora]